MTLETTVRVAARLRRLSDGEFEALVRRVESGDAAVDEATLGRIADALADAAGEVARERPRGARPGGHGRRVRVGFAE